MRKRTLGAGAAVVLALVMAACGGPDLPADATGEEIYVQMCARCHGSDLRGGIGVALVGEGATSIDKPESYLVQSIYAGIGSMPAFRRTLTDDQILRVARYIMQQQGR